MGNGVSLPPAMKVRHGSGGCRSCWRWNWRWATTPEPAPDPKIDDPVFTKENVRLGPFQIQILECRTTPLLRKSAHVMVMPLKAGKKGGTALAPWIACVAHLYPL